MRCSLISRSFTALIALLLPTLAYAQTRVNIGGPAITDPQGVAWAADTFNLGNSDGGAANATVAGTNAPQLFKTARWFGGPTTYTFTVDGSKTYTVRTHHADTWPSTQKVGARVWSVEVNGQSRGPIDLFARVGANKAYIESWSGVAPVNGKISVTFRLGASDNPVVSAIEVIPEESMADLRVTWQHATTNEDGSALTDRAGYRIERAAEEAGPWTTAATVGKDINSSTLKVPYGKNCIRVVTLSLTAESAPSAPACATKAPPSVAPRPPGNVGVQYVELALVTGSTTGQRAVFARTSTGSRGSKLGDLLVGPVAQTTPPFDRVKCSPTDAFQFGQARYSRVIDVRAPANLRNGYVSGCVNYGMQ